MFKFTVSGIYFLSLCLLSVFSSFAQEENASVIKERLWYTAPAKDWFEALPLGNGRLGAMVHGDVHKEHLQLNEESLWAGTPENPYPDDVQKHYTKFQQLSLEGEYEKALAYGLKKLTVSPTSIRSYEPLGDLYIALNHKKKATAYKRQLDLRNGISTITYSVNGKRYIRESFVSSKYDVLFYHVESLDKKPITATVTFDRQKDIEQFIEGETLHIKGQIFDDVNAADPNPGGSGKGGYHMKFDARVAINSNGKQKESGKTITIKKATEFTVMLSATTDYNLALLNYDRSINTSENTASLLKKAKNVSYKQARKEHIAEHSAMYNRVELKIADTVTDTIPTNHPFKKCCCWQRR